MSAVLQEESPKHDSILNYATEKDLEEVRQIFLRGDSFHSDVSSIRTALGVASRKLEQQQRYSPRQLTYTDKEKLKDEIEDLQHRLTVAEGIAEHHSGAYRVALIVLIRKCAEKAAADYVEATKKQAWAHLHLGVAQSLVGRVVDEIYWQKYIVPGSDYLSTLKNKCSLEDDNAGVPTLAYMSADKLSRGVKNASTELKQHIHELFGSSPF